MKYPKNIDIPVERLEETTSTNDYLAGLCKEGKAREFYTVTAERQTAGKGQRGNHWEAETGKNLLCSIVLYPTVLQAKEQFILSMLSAIAAIDTLTYYTDGFSIKWPNDIYWHDRKIGGILIENELEGEYITQSIIGFGLNVNQVEFHSDAPNPVSLKQILGRDINREELFGKLLHSVVAGYKGIENNDKDVLEAICDLYLQYFYRRTGFHRYRDADGEFSAEFHKLDADGRLTLKDEQGNLRSYWFKEIEFVLHE